MMRQFASSMRQVLPPAIWVTLAVVIYLLPAMVAIACALYVDWSVRPSVAMRDTAELITDGVNAAQGMIVFFLAMAYGGWRAAVNHPAFRTGYNQWLQLTPWRFGKALPMGPITLAPADVVVLGVLSLLLMWHLPTETPATIVLAFMFTYLPLIAMALYMTEQRGTSYALLAALAVYPQLYDRYVLLCVSVGLIYIAAHLLVRESLRRYPWDMHRLLERRRQMKRLVSNNVRRDDHLGWPFQSISLNDPQPMISYFDGISVSLLAGWGVYNLWSVFTSGPMPDIETGVLLVIGIIFVAGVRLFVYTNGHLPPISLFGRLATGRLIILRYDIVLVGPLVTAAAGFAILAACAAWQVPLPITLGVLTSVVLGLVINLGPSRAHWRLTGAYRLTPELSNYNSKQQQEFAKL
jgi:hypothetical protein